jgi:hypothetical protein
LCQPIPMLKLSLPTPDNVHAAPRILLIKICLDIGFESAQ